MTPSKLKTLRLEAGLTQEALAQRAGISLSSIAKYETGRVTAPSYAHVLAIAQVLAIFLNVTVDKLLLELSEEAVAA